MRRDALRVHFAGVGRRDVELVAGPLEDHRADDVYLLAAGAGDEYEPERNEVRERLTRSVGARVHDLEADVRDPQDVANRVGGVIDELGAHSYRFNLSAGPRAVALAGMMVATFWDVIPYTVLVDERPSAADLDAVDSQEGYLYEGTRDVPVYKPGLPPDGVLTSLAVLEDHDGSLRQSYLKNELERRGIIKPKEAEELTAQAKHAQFVRIGTELENLRLARKIGRGRGTRWEATDRGRSTLRIFHGSPRIREPPGR